MFNLHKKAQVTNVNTRLQEDRDRFDNNAKKDPGNLDWLLKEDRKNEDLNTITEKQMTEKDVRVDMEPVITEAQLNKNPEGGLIKNRNSEAVPLQDMSKKYEQEFIDAFRKAAGDDEGVYPDMPKPGSQMVDGQSPKVPTKERSQLLSNYKTREEFDKKNVSANAASAIKDADAMLFHLYKVAAQEGRELSEPEKQIVADINSVKARILLGGPVPAIMDPKEDPALALQEIEDQRAEQAEMTGEQLEEEDLERRSIQDDLFNWLRPQK